MSFPSGEHFIFLVRVYSLLFQFLCYSYFGTFLSHLVSPPRTCDKSSHSICKLLPQVVWEYANLTCQFIALSVRHWRASPSGMRTTSFWRDTSSDRMVSSLGLLDLKQQGQRNLTSWAAAAPRWWAGLGCLHLLLLSFGRGTQVAEIKTHISPN